MKVHVSYDEEGDLLEIQFGKISKGKYRDLGNDIFERIGEDGESKGFAILNFNKRKSKPIEFSLPEQAKLPA